jgi:hypothetical protein
MPLGKLPKNWTEIKPEKVSDLADFALISALAGCSRDASPLYLYRYNFRYFKYTDECCTVVACFRFKPHMKKWRISYVAPGGDIKSATRAFVRFLKFLLKDSGYGWYAVYYTPSIDKFSREWFEGICTTAIQFGFRCKCKYLKDNVVPSGEY